jgi:hypothetical protein
MWGTSGLNQMQYFDTSSDQCERIGKVIGDAISALLYLSVIILALSPLFR